jgi:sugar phosphate isomerase/epimerase
MWQLASRLCAIAGAVLGMIVPATTGRADPGSPPVQAGQAAWAPKLYGFCMDAADSRHRSLPEQARMLHELGFDGAGYELWLGDDLDKNLRTLDEADLKVYLFWIVVHLNSKARPYKPGVPEAIRKLKGRPATICVLLHDFPPGDPRGMEPAIKALRQLGDLAAQSGLRVSIYHHTGDWAESIRQALDVAKQTGHLQVGVNFNLCHWLMVDGQKDYRPVLRENAAKIFAVTINGAKLGSKTWTNGLIQPLDQGDFDNRRLLSTLREIGYRGPIGLMCYGIPGDAREYLERSMKVWKSWQTQ